MGSIVRRAESSFTKIPFGNRSFRGVNRLNHQIVETIVALFGNRRNVIQRCRETCQLLFAVVAFVSVSFVHLIRFSRTL